MSNRPPIRGLLEDLIQHARQLGATDARAIPADQIVVEAHLAKLCRPPGCNNFGLAPSCPPHVSGPAGFLSLLEKMDQALVVKIDVPLKIMLSSQMAEIMGVLHTIVAELEKMAVERGCGASKAFAGGCCKHIFCGDHSDCTVLASGGPCRHPDQARPSMSGFGVHVARLMITAGWELTRASRTADSSPETTRPVCGLVLIGPPGKG